MTRLFAWRGLVAVVVGAAAVLVAFAFVVSRRSDSGAAISATGNVLELRVEFQGKDRTYFGKSHEWYSPATGAFRVERRLQGKEGLQVFDGSVWTQRYEDELERQTGRPAMFRWIFSRPDPLGRPGVAAVDVALGLRHSRFLQVRRHGRSLDGELQLGEGHGRLRFHVDLVGEQPLSAARRKGLFAEPRGRLTHDSREAQAGTPPTLGEPGYWFGPRLGQARAAATIERGSRAVAPGAPRGAYMTIYRLPRSVASPVSLTTHAPTYPGLGEMPASDIWVECFARRNAVRVPTPSGRHFRVTVGSRERAAVTVTAYRRGELAATQAMIVLPDAFCHVDGPVPPRVFKRALHGFMRID